MPDPASVVFGSDRAFHGRPRRLSERPDGTPGERASQRPAISADGAVVAFSSDAPNLVDGDTNHVTDVFVHDGHGLTRITNGNEISSSAVISADGKVVAFASRASNLVAGDDNHAEDVFVHDRDSGVTTCVSKNGNHFSNAPSISADGRFVAYASLADNMVAGDSNRKSDVFLFDRTSGDTRRVSVASDGAQARGASSEPRLSGDGRFVAFTSDAPNLVDGDTNRNSDVFVHDTRTGETACVSRAANGETGNLGSGGPAISADGRFVAFRSFSTNLEHEAALPAQGAPRHCHIFVHDRQTGQTVDATRLLEGDAWSADLSADGRFLTYTTSGQVQVCDMETLETVLVSTPDGEARANGESYAGTLSPDGRQIAYASEASNLVKGPRPRGAQVYVVQNPAPALRRARVTLPAEARENPRVISGEDFVIIDGIRVPKRAESRCR